ncbi:MAG: hypothetical protein AAGM22_00050 [Acidobacteriota bacterium]
MPKPPVTRPRDDQDVTAASPEDGAQASGDSEPRHLESAAKHRILTIVGDQPDDSSYDEILRELAFDRMIGRGLVDIGAGRTLGDLEMRRRLRVWHRGRRS